MGQKDVTTSLGGTNNLGKKVMMKDNGRKKKIQAHGSQRWLDVYKAQREKQALKVFDKEFMCVLYVYDDFGYLYNLEDVIEAIGPNLL